MKRVFLLSTIALAFACLGSAQIGRIIDWWTYAGDSQRTGWEKSEGRFTKDEVKSFQRLWNMKLDNKRVGARDLLPPVVLGTLVGYRGFKELAFVAGSSNNLWAIDADLNRVYWQKHLEVDQAKGGCEATLTAMPALPAPVVFRRSARSGKTPQQATRRPQNAFSSIFAVKPVYVLAGDGKLHRLNQADGEETGTPAQFVPQGARAQYLNITNDALYAVTEPTCDGKPAAIWTLDLEDSAAKPDSFSLEGTSVTGNGGPTLGLDGEIYVQTAGGTLDPASNKYGNTLLSLTPDLKVKNYFAFSESGESADAANVSASPVMFSYKDHALVAVAGADARLYLLDATSPGGADHKTPLSKTEPLTTGVSPEQGVWGNLASWEAEDGTRYVVATVWGAPNSAVQFPSAKGNASNGFIAAFKVQEQSGALSLVPAWISPNLEAPVSPMIAKGVVFALANGAYSRKIKRAHGISSVSEAPRRGAHATLYAFDGVTGEEMYSTGDQVKAPGNLAGITIANGRVYFATTDNTLEVFGKYYEH